MYVRYLQRAKIRFLSCALFGYESTNQGPWVEEHGFCREVRVVAVCPGGQHTPVHKHKKMEHQTVFTRNFQTLPESVIGLQVRGA